MKKRIGVAALGWVLAWPLAGQAADGEQGPAVILEEVVVTATRQAEHVSSVPAHVTVIDEEQIANSTARTIPDLLRSEAGVHVSDITGNGRSFTVDLRGFGETAAMNTLVLVDGRRINQPDLSGADWTLIPLDRIRRIEVVRGGRGSVLYGDNAAGGVVNIITKDGGPTEYSAEVAAGSYDTFLGRASAAGAAGNLSYALSGSYADTDGYRDNGGSEAKNAGLSLRYFAGERAAFDLSGDYHKDDTRLPGALNETEIATLGRTATGHPDDFSETEDFYLKGGAELFFLTDSSLRMDLSYRQREALAFSSFAGGNFTGSTEIDTVALTPHLLIKERIAGMANDLLVGFDYRESEEEIENSSIFFGIPSQGRFRLEKENYGIYINDEITPVERLSLSAGYRYDRVEYSFQPSAPAEKSFSENLYTAGMNYRYGDRSYGYASYAKSFRYPVLDELFNFFTSTIDPSLRPQSSDDWEVGLRHYLAEDFFVQLNCFYLTTEDEIFFNSANFANENLDGETRRQGVEIAISRNFGWAELSTTYAYTDAEVRGGMFAGSELPNVPAHQASLRALVPLPYGFSLALQGHYVGERRFVSDFANAFPEMDDFLVLNAKIKYNWRNISAYLDLNNLLDEEYSEYGVIGSGTTPSFYPSPEINVLAGVAVSF